MQSFTAKFDPFVLAIEGGVHFHLSSYVSCPTHTLQEPVRLAASVLLDLLNEAATRQSGSSAVLLMPINREGSVRSIIMNTNEQHRFNNLYQEYLNALTLQGKSPKTVDMYSRYLRQVSLFFIRYHPWRSPPGPAKTVQILPEDL